MHATPNTSRWSTEPGYLAAIEDPHVRRRHRNAVRASSLREERSEAVEPSHHQMCSAILDAVGLMLADDATRGPAMARAFTQAIRHVCYRTGWDIDHALMDRVAHRVTPRQDKKDDYLKSLRRQRSAEAVAQARDEAREERRRNLAAQRMRRHGLAVLVPEADDPFDLVSFGGDEEST